MLCVLATFELGRLLYGVRVGLIAAAVLALMPYHVIVSRQILLDGPQTLFTTVTLCLLIRFARSGRERSGSTRRRRAWASRCSRRSRA